MLLNEDYEVDLINKLPFYHRKILEYQEISNALTPELENLLIAIDYVLDNWFVQTAKEDGLSRLEKIAEVYPETGDSLDTRRFRLSNKMNEKIPFTDNVLEEKLITLCGGSGNYTVVRDYLHYKLIIDTKLPVAGSYDILAETLVSILPCNMLLVLTNTLNEAISNITYIGETCNTALGYLITMDFDGHNNLGMAFNMGLGLSYGTTGVITNDIAVRNVPAVNMWHGTAVGYASTTIITNE